MKNNDLSSKSEIAIRTPLLDCLDLLSLIARHSFASGDSYFFECFFIRLRHLASYFLNEKSPLIKYGNKFSGTEKLIFDKIINIRHASSHPESHNFWDGNIYISGCFNFNDNDMSVQYGGNEIFLIKEIFPIYKKLLEVFFEIPELSNILNLYDKEGCIRKIEKLKDHFTEILKYPIKILESRHERAINEEEGWLLDKLNFE